MKNRPSQATRRARLAPLDHLRPGSRSRTEPEAPERDAPPADIRQGVAERAEPTEPTERAEPTESTERAEPAGPVTPGAGDREAASGKATSSPAAVATQRHLEGSEQGPA